jgi:TPR repeat protein
MQSARRHQLAARIMIVVGALFPIGLPAAQTEAPAIAQLRTGKFDELQEQFSQVQADYRRGAIDDERLLDAFRVFYVTDPTLEPSFSLWVHRQPKSYAAYLARGIYRKYLGLEQRGGKFISETSETQLRGMQLQFQKAMQDLRKSMELDDKPLLSYLHAMDIAKHFGDAQAERELLDAAAKVDPRNVIVRRKYLLTLETRWGGSPQQMRDFIAECRKQGLPEAAARDFLGRADLDDGWVHHHAKRLPEAEASYRAALPLLAEPELAWESLGYVLVDQHKYQAAVDALSKALAKHPNDRTMLSRRGWAYKQLKQPALAMPDYQRAAELGDDYAQNEVGKHYWHGIAVPKNPEQAIAWFSKAADQGNAEAKRNLAWALSQTQVESP